MTIRTRLSPVTRQRATGSSARDDHAAVGEQGASPTEARQPLVRPPAPVFPDPAYELAVGRGALAHDQERQLVHRLFLPASGRAFSVLFAAVDRHFVAGALCGCVAELLTSQVSGAVCVVDADLRQPSLHTHFGVPAGPGLADVLRNGGRVPDVVQQVRANLWLVPAGAPTAEPGPLFGFHRTGSILQELRERFSYVLVAAAPAAQCNEPVLLGHWTDGMVLVVEAHKTHRERARSVKHRLDVAHVPLLGVVLTNRRFPIPHWLYRWL